MLAGEEATAVGVRELKESLAAASLPARAGLFGVEMVVSRDTGDDLALFGYPQPFKERFI
jgi:hypothetical protein